MNLTLSERLLLLALHDDKGTVISRSQTALPYALAGAVLQELAFLGRLRYSDGKVHIEGAGSTGDAILDRALEIIGDAKKPKDLKHWVKKLKSELKTLRDELLERLIDKGILRRQEHKILWVFPADRYPTEDARPEAEVREHVRHVVRGVKKANEEAVALIALVRACELVGEVFPKDERREASKRIKHMTSDKEIAKSVSSAVAEITAAIAAAATVVVVTSASS